MPLLQLTDLTIRSLKAESRTDYWDTKTPSFGIRIGARTKTFIAKLNNRRISIGTYPSLSLAEARRRAMALKSQKHQSPYSNLALGGLIELFLTVHCRNYRPRSKKEAERLLKKYLGPLEHHSLDSITTHDVSKIIDDILPDAPSEATHVFKIFRTLFRFAGRRSLIAQSPLTSIQMPSRETSRDRVLSDSELRQVWETAQQIGYSFGTIIQLLILTGQRRGEIAALRWEWVDEEQHTITFPPSITKNGRPHTIPVGDMTYRVLGQAGREFCLFPARGKTGKSFCGFGASKEAFDERCPIAAWTLHDLRRTFATNLQKLQVRIEVTEALLGHVSGSLGGIRGVYQRHNYADEKREAISLWENHLRWLLAQAPLKGHTLGSAASVPAPRSRA